MRALLFAALVSFTLPAGAFTLDGAITGGSADGRFVKLDPKKNFAVGNDTFQNDNLYAFDEDQNITLQDTLVVDIATGSLEIAAGTVVASHYVFFDPSWGSTITGHVDFDAPILGIAVNTWTLKASDFLANTNVTYLNPGLRGLEWDDRIWIDPDNPFRLHIRWSASTPGDYIRVFTGASPSA
ncbi:MAG: hypothetical protein AAGE61_02145 [Pseudomonadota bacterium]